LRVVATELPGVLVVEPTVWRDARGSFVETWHARRYAEAGIPDAFVQDNRSRSVRGTIRGLHLQTGRPQGKLVQIVEGEVYDVAADVRIGSPCFGRWVGTRLTGDDARQLWIPAGFAHGFCVLSAEAVVEYKCTAAYDPASEVRIAWDDPDLGVRWPVPAPLLSDGDRAAPRLAQVRERLPAYPGV
jgi:dTDP-4-dehydrorhamnose 3,5-epimerase